MIRPGKGNAASHQVSVADGLDFFQAVFFRQKIKGRKHLVQQLDDLLRTDVGSKKPVTPATGLSLSSARTRKKRNRARFGNYRRISPNANGRDPRSVAELAFGEASSGGAEFCAPPSLKISFAGQSLDRLAHSAARKRSVASIARLTSPICLPPIVPKQPHSMFNPRARAYQFPVEFGTLGRAALPARDLSELRDRV